MNELDPTINLLIDRIAALEAKVGILEAREVGHLARMDEMDEAIERLREETERLQNEKANRSIRSASSRRRREFKPDGNSWIHGADD